MRKRKESRMSWWEIVVYLTLFITLFIVRIWGESKISSCEGVVWLIIIITMVIVMLCARYG